MIQNENNEVPNLDVICGTTIWKATSGMLQSPDYPQPYPAGLECRWKIEVEESMVCTRHQTQTSVLYSHGIESFICSTQYRFDHFKQVNFIVNELNIRIYIFVYIAGA